ncbi:Short-chain dehydrogenase [Cupriavidus necator]|uniref:SDR family NAD(P)-dependent oxidoreductase n=1 Tax=Cupriavidus necator (strain ATCC 17699 / DSM 428 / KCTC 22496 / NCIMB 10442 / H16 / Stanier 337) TaxID=381666 RepID=Q0JZY2_CUPNH|nr:MULTISPECIES: oxidoreductase [Cupriavidus]EON18092.1 short chain dehydrogenase [Cupriavidus sp. GA3-3]KUE90755.1 short-chain dehydrogenase [Cupriavidus necator]QCC04511.1 SDR family NAD(P)-dependent oxidoreductase [Cupriavidus necator H16]QQB79203.1 SDR family NAD(P)-dependent oxidoreductase [Cupriavidus necator]WKA43425.1 oxidoreductase [Cupriavidus necator]
MSANTTNTAINAASKVWFITGASRGFGLELTRAALARGDRVVATARRPETITAALGEHDNLVGVALDVTNEAQAIAAAEAAVARFGRIDVLVNNAGYGLLGAVEEASAEEVEQQFATNVFGVLTVTRAVLPQMRRQRSGRILNISSIGGYAAYPGWGVYGATKFAVEGLTEALDAELSPLGIRATVVEPGFFRTDFLDASSLVRVRTEIAAYADTVGAMREHMASANHQQPGDPAKLAAALLTLADSETPPVRLPLGSDTVYRITEKNRKVESELAAWQALAVSTDHDDVRR